MVLGLLWLSAVIGTLASSSCVLATRGLPDGSDADLDGGTVTPTAESGAAVQGASGTIVGNALEASNTSIEGQFTTMIMTQQAYSAITKVVTTSDQMLATVTNWVT